MRVIHIGCPRCSGRIEPVDQTRLQSILYSEAFVCTGCGVRMELYRGLISFVINNHRFLFSRYSHCLSCGSANVDRGRKAHSVSKNPLGWIQLLAAAPLMECYPCGRQYFDWRIPRPGRFTAVATRATHDLVALSKAIRTDPSESMVEREVQDSKRPFSQSDEAAKRPLQGETRDGRDVSDVSLKISTLRRRA